MSQVKHDVPLIGQVNENSCWNASAWMIWRYWQAQTRRQGPMNTVRDAYARSEKAGIYPLEFIRLAEKVGLKAATFKYPISRAELANLLSRHGPLWCAGYWWGTAAGDVIVATGISDDVVFINDPAPQGKGERKTKGVGEFNSQLAQQHPGCIMYKDPSRY